MAAQEGATSSRPLIEGRLALCTEALKAADANLSRLSLEAVTSGDDTEALAALDHLHKLEVQHGLLCKAMDEADRVEAARQKELRAAQNVSAKRALAQHSGRFARDAADVAKAISDLHDATERLTASGQSIIGVCPPHLRTPSFPIHELLSPHGLNGRIAVEQFRLDRTGPKPRPGFTYENNASGEILPMVEVLSALLSQVREDFDCAPPPTKPPLPVSSPSASSPPADSGNDAGPLPPSLPAGADQPQTHSGELGHQGRLTGVAVSLRGGQQTLVEMTEHFAPPSEQDGSEQARSAVVKAAVVPVPDMACGQESATAQAGIDFTPLFHGGQQ